MPDAKPGPQQMLNTENLWLNQALLYAYFQQFIPIVSVCLSLLYSNGIGKSTIEHACYSFQSSDKSCFFKIYRYM